MRYCGWSELFHDAGIAFVTESGEIDFATHGERYTQRKFDPYLPEILLGMIKNDDHVTFYEDHSIRKNKWKSLEYDIVSHSFPMQQVAYDALDYDDFTTHHLSHAAAGFATRPWESSEDTVILTVDGVGEWQTVGAYNHKYEEIFEMQHPLSLGLFYTYCTKLCGLRTMEEEYVTMGMSSYGQDILSDQIWSMFWDLKDKGVSNRNHYKEWFDHKTKNMKKEDIAASIQAFAEQFFMYLAEKIAPHGKKLVVSGGCAQNIIAMTKLKQSGLFEDVWVAVAPTDAGSALGAAAYSYWKHTGHDRINWTDAFLGYDMGCTINPKEVVDHLLEHEYCGIASGRAEYGPRALGNRSLIADPRKDVKDTVNTIKRRQKYRPFAPAILEEYAEEYFDGPMNEYMQYVAKAKHDMNSVIHVDGTSRVQIVRKDCSSIFRKIIEEFYDRTGVPMLLNTSLNIRGKPMVNNKHHANDFEMMYRVKVFT